MLDLFAEGAWQLETGVARHALEELGLKMTPASALLPVAFAPPVVGPRQPPWSAALRLAAMPQVRVVVSGTRGGAAFQQVVCARDGTALACGLTADHVLLGKPRPVRDLQNAIQAALIGRTAGRAQPVLDLPVELLPVVLQAARGGLNLEGLDAAWRGRLEKAGVADANGVARAGWTAALKALGSADHALVRVLDWRSGGVAPVERVLGVYGRADVAAVVPSGDALWALVHHPVSVLEAARLSQDVLVGPVKAGPAHAAPRA